MMTNGETSAVDLGTPPSGDPRRPAGAGLAYESIRKVFGKGADEFVALDDIDFSTTPGDFVSLVGPSGCGKSTLLKLTAGLLNPTAGSVLVGGKEINGPRTDIGLMLQTSTLFPWRNVVENISLPLDIRRDRSKNREARIHEVLELVGLTGFEYHYPRELSGGMQQRVALCRLLISDPDLMLLDEPFGALDEFTREHLNTELARICEHEHKTTLFVTHNVPESVFLSDVVVVMGAHPGRVLEIIEVDLPRPRLPKLRDSPEFSEICVRIRSILGLS
ncbi:MAG: ABC transporter ATP-binding protein [Actinomycetota bacterium]|nr:ABC transporter ATP-binding protein [Actinomycetota bacterium]